LTLNQTADQWTRDISSASAASIDGFALNIGAADQFTRNQLALAYEAANKFDNFSLFLSFDFLAGIEKKNVDCRYRCQPDQHLQG